MKNYTVVRNTTFTEEDMAEFEHLDFAERFARETCADRQGVDGSGVYYDVKANDNDAIMSRWISPHRRVYNIHSTSAVGRSIRGLLDEMRIPKSEQREALLYALLEMV